MLERKLMIYRSTHISTHMQFKWDKNVKCAYIRYNYLRFRFINNDPWKRNFTIFLIFGIKLNPGTSNSFGCNHVKHRKWEPECVHGQLEGCQRSLRWKAAMAKVYTYGKVFSEFWHTYIFGVLTLRSHGNSEFWHFGLMTFRSNAMTPSTNYPSTNNPSTTT